MTGRGLIHGLRSRIALKLTLTLVGFVAVSLIAAGLYLSRALERVAIEVLESRLTVAGRVLLDEAVAAAQPTASAQALQRFMERATRATGMRVSLIAPDGRVLADSERPGSAVATMDNHADRPEVRAALEGRVGSSFRRSVTLDTPLIYVALPLTQGGRVIGVLRLAEPISAVTASYETLRSAALAGGAVALLVALGIGVFVAGRVTRPVVEMQDVARQMSEGHFDVRAPARSPDEIGTLGRSLNVMAGRLREKIGDLEREQAKATAVLDAMVEGVIATDGHDHIILINERARGIFGLGTRRVQHSRAEVSQGILHGLGVEMIRISRSFNRGSARRQAAAGMMQEAGRLLRRVHHLELAHVERVDLRQVHAASFFHMAHHSFGFFLGGVVPQELLAQARAGCPAVDFRHQVHQEFRLRAVV
jgi:two-component system phosphate regulon sensor histidine kinase PhoR